MPLPRQSLVRCSLLQLFLGGQNGTMSEEKRQFVQEMEVEIHRILYFYDKLDNNQVSTILKEISHIDFESLRVLSLAKNNI